MKLAYVSLPGRGRTDDLISEAARGFQRDGLRVAGVIRARPVDRGAHPCDMDLTVLPDGPAFSISQPLGQGAKGCRLDGGQIEQIAAEVERRVPGADLLIVNKFGKQEALGRGFCAAISAALEADIPVLVGVNDLNTAEFLAFADGLAEFLHPDVEAIRNWLASNRAAYQVMPG